MGVTGAGHLQTRGTELSGQFRRLVDAHVPTLVGVVLVRERPAHLFRPVPRNGHSGQTAGRQDPGHLGDGVGVVRDVFEDLRHEHHVELPVTEGKPQGVTDLGAGLGRSRYLPLGDHRVEHLGNFGHVALGLIECDHIGAAPEHLERVPTLPRTDIDGLGVRSYAQSIKING